MATRRRWIEGTIVVIASLAIAVFYLSNTRPWRLHHPWHSPAPAQHSTTR